MLNKITQRIPLNCYPYKRFMHKNKCIFVHIPKNAGTSVLSLFNDTSGRKHAKWFDFYESNSFFFKRYHKFAIVRDPLTRLYSAYCYAKEGGNQSTDDIALQLTINKYSDNFESFVSSILDEHFIMLQILFNPQYLYIFDRQHNCKIDSVLKFEELETDWLNLAKELDFPAELPVTNRMNKNTVQQQSPASLLSDEAMNKVKNLYYYDYLLLGYQPEVRDIPTEDSND